MIYQAQKQKIEKEEIIDSLYKYYQKNIGKKIFEFMQVETK